MCRRLSQLYVTYVQKIFFDSNFNKAVIDKMSFFHEMAPLSHTHKNRDFKSIIENWLTNCFYPKDLMAGACKEPTFSFFNFDFDFFFSCEPFRLNREDFAFFVGNWDKRLKEYSVILKEYSVILTTSFYDMNQKI